MWDGSEGRRTRPLRDPEAKSCVARPHPLISPDATHYAFAYPPVGMAPDLLEECASEMNMPERALTFLLVSLAWVMFRA